MEKIIKDIMTPPWMARLFQPELPLTEDTIRPFIEMIWGYFGLDHSDPGKGALIKFCLQFGKERPKYNLRTIEPVTWGFINGFDEGFAAGYQKAWATWEAWAKENNVI